MHGKLCWGDYFPRTEDARPHVLEDPLSQSTHRGPFAARNGHRSSSSPHVDIREQATVSESVKAIANKFESIFACLNQYKYDNNSLNQQIHKNFSPSMQYYFYITFNQAECPHTRRIPK